MIFNQLRRAAADAMSAIGLQIAMPEVRVNASKVQQLLERYDKLEAENARLRHELAYAANAVASLPHVESLCMTDSTLSIAAGLRKALNPTSAGGE